MMRDRAGAELQRMLDRLERSAGRRPLGPIVLGGSLALGVFLGGLVTFAAVLVILVGLFH